MLLYKRLNRFSFKILSIMLIFSSALLGSDIAKNLFREYSDRIYQVRVIEKVSGKKTSIGSAFLVSSEGLIATNFHVIADAVHDPDLYKLELVKKSDEILPVTIEKFDVVHDLAIIRDSTIKAKPFSILNSELENGTEMFSLGNPKGLGSSIVSGTYNGLLKKSMYRKIHFSGAINPGMSGGPGIDQNGNVVGINVATSGNQISFLVPANFLIDLLNKKEIVSYKNYKKEIEQQILDNQNSYLKRLLTKEWELDTLGNALVPSIMSGVFECWGEYYKDVDSLYYRAASGCFSKDHIYINSNFKTGMIYYRYDLYENRKLNQFQFYNLYEKQFEKSLNLSTEKEEEITEYNCNTKIVKHNGKKWKVVLCLRQYKKYEALYDVFLKIAMVSEKDNGLLLNLILTGVSKSNGIAVSQKMLESVKWID